jgi:hypothetical protein
LILLQAPPFALFSSTIDKQNTWFGEELKTSAIAFRAAEE